MKLTDFDYLLPKDLIAQFPNKNRDSARLMILNRKKKTFEHKIFRDLAEIFNSGDVLVLNDTKVMPARLFGNRLSGGKVEVLLLKRKENFTFEVLLRPGRIKLGEKISFSRGKFYGQLVANNEINFLVDDVSQIYAQGVMPLPPYIKRQAQEEDKTYYQTVFAKFDGSIAAPTAGLHFTEELLEKIKNFGVKVCFVTLHVGQGTFKPVETEDIREHKIHEEYFSIPQETLELIKEAKNNGKRIFAVGTTALRSLEASVLGQTQGYTSLFIYPGYEFKVVDCLLTNFHLPKTTLFMLVCALGGSDFAKEAYRKAIEEKYMFYSYGDAMLIV